MNNKDHRIRVKAYAADGRVVAYGYGPDIRTANDNAKREAQGYFDASGRAVDVDTLVLVWDFRLPQCGRKRYRP